MIEIWKPIPGYGDNFEASSLGRIRSKDRVVIQLSAKGDSLVTRNLKGRLLTIQERKLSRYLFVGINYSGLCKNQSVHKLVALAFCGVPKKGMQVRHLNGDPRDNRSANLAWGTFEENQADIVRHGTRAKGEKVGTSKLTTEQVELIKRMNSPTLVSRMFNIGRSQYYRIKNGTAWNHVGAAT